MFRPLRSRLSFLASCAVFVTLLAPSLWGQGARNTDSSSASSSLDLRQFETQSSWLNGLNPDVTRQPEGIPGSTGRRPNKVMVDRKELQKLIDRRRNWIFHSYSEAGGSQFSLGSASLEENEEGGSDEVSLSKEDARYNSSFARFVLDDWQRRAQTSSDGGENAEDGEETPSVFEPALGFSEDDSYAFGASTFLSRAIGGSGGNGDSVTERWEQAAGGTGALGTVDPRSLAEAENAMQRGFDGAASLAYLRRTDRERFLETQADFGKAHGFQDIFGDVQNSLYGSGPLGDTGLPTLSSAATVDIESEVNPTREPLNPILPGAGTGSPLASPQPGFNGGARPLPGGLLGATPGIGASARPTRPLAPTGPGGPGGRSRTRTILQMPNHGL